MVAGMTRAWCSSLVLVVACGASQPVAQPGAASVAENAEDAEAPTPPVANPVELDLLADVSAVAAGQTFTVAARLRVEPGWHIYWLNPGEAGQPTIGTFAVPTGFAAGAVRYPGPASFEGAGGMRLYGYAKEVMLSSEVSAPESVTGPATIAVEARWLACSEACVKGSARAEIALPAASDEAPSQPVNQELFARHGARLVEPLADTCAIAKWEADAVSLFCPGAEQLEFFPDTELQPAYAGQLAMPQGGGVALRVSVRGRPVLSGVLRLTGRGGATYYAVALPPPA
jgi:DsbC/DsbD-like thiol-disulfide interchange protein